MNKYEKTAKDEILNLSKLYLENSTLILFGSRAKNTNTRYSDFDLAVLPPKEFKKNKLTLFIDAIQESSKIIYPVDVVLYDDLALSWQKTIREEGQIWKS